MSVKSGQAARDELLKRLGGKPEANASRPEIDEAYPFVRADPPSGFVIEKPAQNSIWAAQQETKGLRDPGAYQLPGLPQLNRPPATGLSDASPESRQKYCQASIDITMRGGTTSGVVYPLVVCELAREYRLRNVGGASAGAIAAAAAAAAEAGRSHEGAASGNSTEVLSEDARKQGHVRPGFAGFADCMAWLAEADDDGEYFRVGQLFRPTQTALPLFRLAAAYMRRRYLAIPLLFVGAFGKTSKWVNIGLFAAALVFAGIWPGRDEAPLQSRRGSLLRSTGLPGGQFWRTVGHYLAALGQGVIGLVAYSMLVAGIVALVMTVLSRNGSKWLGGPDVMKEPVLDVPAAAAGWRVPLGLLVIGAILGIVDFVVYGVPWLQLLAVWLFAVVALAAAAIVAVLHLLLGAEKHSFGMVSGSSPALGRSLWNWVAGLPQATVERPLVHWLSETISELSGLETGNPLLFGHLWFGPQYSPGSRTSSECRAAAGDPALRLVNLELVTTELVQGLSYKFPLPPSAELNSEANSGFYLRRSDLAGKGSEVFPPEVVAVLCRGTPVKNAFDRRTGAPLDDLFPLPEPWDLPVIFAVRLSMSLPALLQAVRVYRISKWSSIVRDEFGQHIHRAGAPAADLEYPARSGPADKRAWAEELWFSDGGITSNFPVHLFDSLFPMWPTVGITLSSYPPGYRHQDVWLPQDWQGHQVIGAPVDGGMAGFVGKIIDAARGWRDTAQSQMPAYAGRIATVRQSKTEGGTNLFMRKETIAALALRGELAGARLRRRFRSSWWKRNQWLRFRTSVGNLENLRQEMRQVTTWGTYAQLAGGDAAAGFNEIKTSVCQGDPDLPGQISDPDPWWEPGTPAYWVDAPGLITTITGSGPAPELDDRVPQPEPELRQIPPV